MAYNYVNETGVIIADTSTIKEDVTTKYKDAFGQDLVTDNGSPASVLITKDTIQRTNLNETAALIANQINPDLASGIFLDAIWSLTNGQRRQSTSTIVTATVTGVIGTVIPIGSVAETTSNDRFISQSEATIPLSGSIDVVFASETKGAIPCPSGSLINISDGGVLGWETITNTSAGVLGLETQSDIEARVDRRLSLATGAKGTTFSITSGLYALNEVKSLSFRENHSNTSETIDGVTMLPNSIYVCVDGASDEDVANALYEYKTLGVPYNNGASADPKEITIVAPDSGQNYIAKFDRPDEITVAIQITVKSDTSATNQIPIIKDAILQYANSAIRLEGFKVGNDVSPFEIVQYVANSTSFFVTNCLVTKQVDNDFQPATISIDIWEKAITSESLIQVTLV